MARIDFIDVSKSFGKNTVIDSLDLSIEDGKFTIIVGPSGCGKTTLMRMIAGIGPQSSGQVQVDGVDVTDIAPGQRGVAMVFQNYAIYPTMNVYDNIEFGLKNNKVPKEERQRIISEVCEVVGLTDYLKRKPSELSGGQRQRVALARAMVKEPKVFLMDEPLSNLDAKLRVQMRVELIEMHKRLKTTFVYVTHDQVEAMSMADTIVLMNNGKIMQHAAPEVIYKDPQNLFTAQFIGTPPTNVIKTKKDDVFIGFRPERTFMSSQPMDGAMCFKTEIATREMLGAETIYSVRHKGVQHMVKTNNDTFKVGQTIYAWVNKDDIYLFDKNEDRIKNDSPYFHDFISNIQEVIADES